MYAISRLFSMVLGICATIGTASAQPMQVAPQQGVLLLRNQNVLSGKISRVADHYFVAVPGGKIRVRASEVELFCRDLDEAYRRKQAALEQGRASQHLALAEWCLRQKLLGYAAKEVLDARAADPTHPKIVLVERRLLLAARAGKSTKTGRPTRRATPRRSSAEELEQMMQSLPPGAVEMFTLAVQPLLLNSCSTAACHGPSSKTEFRFERTAGRTTSRRLTQRNLYAVMQQIDQDHPEQSPLLIKANAAHAPVKTGHTKSLKHRQYRRLADWVRLVTAREVPNATTVDHPPVELLQTIDGIALLGGASVRSQSSSQLTAPRRALGQDAKTAAEGTQTSRSQPRKGAKASSLSDPFDPAIFNRRHASRPR